MMLARPWTTASTSLCNDAGQPSSPMLDVIHSNCPKPGNVKAVNCLDFGWSNICQKPEVKSRVEKITELERPISLIHSVTSCMVYLST